MRICPAFALGIFMPNATKPGTANVQWHRKQKSLLRMNEQATYI
jgi:hypothetical protein